ARVGGLCKSSPQIYLPGGVCRCCPAPRDRNSILLAYHMRRILADPQFLVQLLVHLRDAFPTEVALQFTRPRRQPGTQLAVVRQPLHRLHQPRHVARRDEEGVFAIEQRGPSLILDFGFWILDCRLWTLDFGLWTFDWPCGNDGEAVL